MTLIEGGHTHISKYYVTLYLTLLCINWEEPSLCVLFTEFNKLSIPIWPWVPKWIEYSTIASYVYNWEHNLPKAMKEYNSAQLLWSHQVTLKYMAILHVYAYISKTSIFEAALYS